MMYLILGHPEDPCCQSVYTALKALNYPTRIITNPLSHPSRFEWRLDNEQSVSRLTLDEETLLPGNTIAGVLVRSTGWIDPAGWQPDDLAYMQAETQAALLAWLWSLMCPVVNRYPSAIWYHPHVPLLSWQGLLRRCGLPTLETLVTNVQQEARAFGQNLAREGVAGAVYGPLTSGARYIVTSEEDWTGLTAMQSYSPVCLTYPHEAAQLVCVVGERVIWEGDPPPETVVYEAALRRFAEAAGLVFVELAFANTARGVCIIAVEPHPHVDRFGEKARQQITDGIVHLLTTEADTNRKRPVQKLIAGIV
jgi:hypothetical protein